MSTRTQFLLGLKWTVLGRAATQVATWAVTIYIMRLVGPEDYGLMALAAIFSAFFALLSELGLGSAVIRGVNIQPRQLRQIFGIVLLSNVSVCLLMGFFVAPAASIFFGESRLELVVQIIALQFLPAAFSVVPAALLSRAMKFKGRAIVDFSSSLGGALITLALAHWGYGVFALVWGSIVTATIRAIGLNIFSPFVGVPVFQFSGCGTLFNFGRNVTQTQFVWFFYSQVDSFIVGKVLGKHDLGVYSVSMDLASLPASRVSGILNQIVFPTLSKIQREGGAIGNALMKGLRGVSLLSFPVMWGLSSVSPEFVQTFLGEKWVEAILPLTLMCLIMPLRVLSPLMHNGLYAIGRADVSFQITCITAIVMCSAFLLGAQFGLIGLSLSWVLVFPVVFLFNLLKAGDLLKIRTREIVIALFRPSLASGLMYGAVMLIRPFLSSTPLVNLVVLVMVGAIAYAVFSLAFNREGLFEIRNLIRNRSI